MNVLCRVAVAVAVAAIVAVPSFAQGPAGPAVSAAAPQPPDVTDPDDPRYEETVVVSGSRAEEKLVNTPVTMTVIGTQQIERATSPNFAELLRSVPGLNITQTSARDINVTSRAPTGTLATGQLALLDGRSLYQDFFGFVMWDFLPVNLNEIKQVEVIRGPASAVWGANAVNGVINVITKTPREMLGTTATLGLGTFERAGGEDAGSLWYISGTHAAAINDRWAFKLSAGGYSQDPLSRPTGPIRGSPVTPRSPLGTPYPAYTNSGTSQPKFDGRLDYDSEDGRRLSFTGGVAGTEGIMHSGIGPFDIESGTVMSYGRVNFSRRRLRAAAFVQSLDGDATNLIARGPAGGFIPFQFKTNTADLEISDLRTFASRHVVSYGGNLRRNTFDLSIAPESDNRTEFGVYGQDEIFLSRFLRATVGARVDRFDYLDSFVLSPRAALLIKPRENHTFRVSYNRAYRSPSVINNFLDTTLTEPLPLGQINPALAPLGNYLIPIRVRGNTDLEETSLDAYELGYTGVIAGRTVLSAAVYLNKTKNDILFTENTAARWTAANPPPNYAFGFLPPQTIPLISPGGFPASFTYRNFGRTTQKGLELGVDTSVNRHVSFFTNYSYQAEPEPEGFDISELNLPAKNRFNAGTSLSYGRVLGNVSLSYSDRAFWQDVLDDRYHGTTEPYTLVNAGLGVKWGSGDRVTTSVKVTNLANQSIMQHVFGDITRRQIAGELRVHFGGPK
ncbi:MAG: TonB-dependent receptor [Acidobacteriota bacterium]|nr:TonB-dependent receptor [Acidobacteriota bacterium]